MLEPGIKDDELERLESLKELHILDTPIDDSFERITRLVKTVFNTPIVAISLVDEKRQWFKSQQVLDVCETSRAISFCGHAILNDGLFVVKDASQDVRFSDNPLVVGEPHIRFYASHPLKSLKGHAIGTLCIIDHAPRDFSEEDAQALKDFAAIVEKELISQNVSIAQQALMDELNEAKRKSLIDSLARVWNRSAIEQIYFKQYAYNLAQEKKMGLAMLDIDFFKAINDKYGHDAGDFVLKEICKTVLKSLRGDDAFGRWGGEEFLIVFNNDQQDVLRRVAERIKDSVENLEMVYEGNHIKASLTIGLVIFDPSDEGVTPKEMIHKADELLYEGKKSGRNKAVILNLKDLI